MTSTASSLEAERAAFEAWSRSTEGGGFTLDRYNDPQCTEYVHYNTDGRGRHGRPVPPPVKPERRC